MMNKNSLLTAVISVASLTLIIILAVYFLANQRLAIGPALIILGVISLAPSIIFKIPLRSLKADIIFGMIDNGILVIFALIGAEFFGLWGAIVGGAVGNAITDGFAGIFEGFEAQRMRKLKIDDKRTALSTATGKLAGCFFGAGIVLTIAWSILTTVKLI